MASIQTGSIVANISGSVGSESYSRNAYGPYVKSRVTPTNPNTAAQQAARSDISDAVAAWQALTDAQRNAYVVEARQRSVKNRLGISTRLTGYNLFVRQFVQCAKAGAPDPVSIDRFYVNDIFTLSSVVVDSTQLEVVGVLSSKIAATRIAIYASQSRSPGQISFNPSTLRLILVINPSTGSISIDCFSEYESIFGALSGKTDDRITIGFSTFNYRSAYQSKTLYESAIVGA